MKQKWLTDIPFAHRGLHGPMTGFAENSLSAFQAANKIGHGFELDILLSKDNRAMVCHDVVLERLTGLPDEIHDFTAKELSTIKLTSPNRGPDSNSVDHILSLGDILKNCDPRYPILIEIKGDQGKYDDIAEAVFNEIEHYDGPKAIMSFYPDIISWFHKNAPQITRGLVATSLNDGELPDDYFSTTFQKSVIEQLKVDFIAYDIKMLPNDVTEYCHKKDIAVLTWTVRTEAQKQKAAQHTDNSIYEIIGSSL